MVYATESSIYNGLVFLCFELSIQFFREITASDQLGQKLIYLWQARTFFTMIKFWSYIYYFNK